MESPKNQADMDHAGLVKLMANSPTAKRKLKEAAEAKSQATETRSATTSLARMRKDVRDLGIEPSKIKAEEWRVLEASVKEGRRTREEALYEIAQVAEKRSPRKESRDAGPLGNFAP
jgi:hypothetical protein